MKTLIHIGLLAVFLLAGTADAMDPSPAGNLPVSFDLKKNLMTERSGVFPEELATCLANDLYGEQKGKGWEYRRNLLINYENYTGRKKDFPLINFSGEGDFPSMAIGCGKGVMLFHMLQNIIGRGPFDAALQEFPKEKNFQNASWDALRIAFEKAWGQDLEWFFVQWLDRNKIPVIEITNPNVIVAKGIMKVSFDIIQKNGLFQLNLPVAIQTDKGEVSRIIPVGKEKETFEVPVPGSPVEIIVDRDYDLLRKLSEEEHPPVISSLLGDEKRLVVIPVEEEERKYSDLIGFLKEQGFALKKESEIKDEDIRQNSLLIAGGNSPMLRRLFGGIKKSDSGFTMEIRKNPLNPLKVIAVVTADSKEEVSAVLDKLFHYGRNSSVRFEKGRNIGTDTAKTKRGIRVDIDEPVTGIQPRKTLKLDEIIPKILDKPIIYLGERHGNFEDHRVQLKVIMALHESGHKFAIGMEMFQKPFQRAINDYQAGIINEKDFLKTTQYFKRWQFDYNLYREIIEYARANNIPLVALNMWSEIVKTVATAGLDALTDSEKAQLPEDMDMSDEDYRQRLKVIFETHKNHESLQFENFHQAQILWDETMAHAVNVFLKRNTDYQMAVLAGVGHIIYGSGIPKRAFRLNGKEYVTVIPATGEPIGDSADFVLFPEPVSPPETVKLGIISKKTNGSVSIEKIQQGSTAEEAGLEKNDVLVSIDEWKIEDIDDVRISLFDKKHGDRVIIKLLRKRFLAGYTELQFEITL